jgi:hypothetical protein
MIETAWGAAREEIKGISTGIRLPVAIGLRQQRHRPGNPSSFVRLQHRMGVRLQQIAAPAFVGLGNANLCFVQRKQGNCVDEDNKRSFLR